MSYTIKPSIGMLPIDDLVKVLIANGKIVTPESIEYVTMVPEGEYKATPGIKNPGMIAICAGAKNQNGTLDRETIKNSLKLNGKDASEYMTKEDKNLMGEEINASNKVQSNEIQLLRDELYSLKAELVKAGHINDTLVADGYIDAFKNSNIKYDTQSTLIEKTATPAIKQISKIVEKGDWVIAQPDISIKKYRNADVISENGNEVELNISTSAMESNNAMLHTSLGEYNKGTFSFSKIETESVGEERYTMLNDDTNVIKEKINSDYNGIAALIRIPERSKGALTKVKIFGEALGNPGALTCYVINAENYESLDGALIDLENNINVIGKSLPVRSSEVVDGEITFNITLGEGNIVEVKNKDYLFLIKADNLGSTSDYWEVELGARKAVGSSLDLQTNNKTYKYFNNKLSGSGVNGDLLHVIVTKAIKLNEEVAYPVGLYTTAEPIKMSEPIVARRARIALEISKEGNIFTDNTSEVKESIKVEQNNNMFCTGDTIIIGDTIRKVTSVDGEDILVLDKPLYIESNTSIYKCAYEVKLKTYKTNRDERGVEVINPSSVKLSNLKLVSIIPSGRKDSLISDRLIFEAETDGLDFNRAELQIRWHSTYNGEIKGDYVGRIHNLSLAFDRTV